ncbi:MAG: hypothetical protein QM330_11695 [Acidobacteriota bacterium]|jgi:cytochrome c biogenesis protein|nr:hypothetical protein [Acidobacteriota bacterium]NLT31878.1 hypothetical protein [Acidobacteriota bacterium]
MGNRIWKFLAGVNLTLWLLWAAIALMLVGGLGVKANKAVFDPLNRMLLQDWLREWGAGNLDKTWWLLLLALVLFLLGINTACCILDRLAYHWNRRNSTGTRTFLVRVTPTLIHACFGIILAGHFASMCVGFRSRSMEFVSRPGETTHYTLPGGLEMAVGEPQCEFFPGPFAGSIRQCRADIVFGTGERRQIEIGRPLHSNGFQIYMMQAGSPGKTAPYVTPQFELLVKSDPGLGLIMACFFILILLTLFYYGAGKSHRMTTGAGTGEPPSDTRP